MASCKNIIVTATLVLAASLNCAAANSYKISASLLYNGELFGEPTLIVQDDKPASIEVSGPDGYKLSIIVTEVASDRVEVSATLDSSRGRLSSVAIVRPEQPATVEEGDIGLTLTVQRSGN